MSKPMILSDGRPWLWLIGGVVATAIGCGSTISLRDLERKHAAYEGRLVTVAGCYRNGPESTLLKPCSEPRPNELVWIVARSQLEGTAKSVPGYGIGSVQHEYPSAKEEALARELSNLPNGVVAEVRLRGEFQSSTGATFGAPPGYRYQFVVHRVLSVSPRQLSNR